MATTTVFLRKVNTRILEQPLNVRFRHGAAGKCELVISTGYQILPQDLKNGRVSGDKSREINDLLHTVQSDLMQAFESLQQRGVPVTKITMQAKYQQVKSDREATEKRRRQEVLQADYEAGSKAIASRLREGELEDELQQLQQKLERQREQTRAKAAIWDVTSREATIPDLTQELTEVMVESGYIKAAPTSADLLVSYVNRYLDEKKSTLSKATVRAYTAVVNLLNRFNPDLRIQDVDRACLYVLQDHCIRENIGNSSIENYITKVKSILNYFAGDVPVNLSYKKYKFELALSTDDVIYFETAELASLLNFDVDSIQGKVKRSYQRAKDIMILLCGTGIRYSDAFNNFRPLIRTVKNDKGELQEHIILTPTKTRKKRIQTVIPVTKMVQDVLSRYDYQIPQMEDYYFNEIIKEVLKHIPGMRHQVVRTSHVGSETITETGPKYQFITSHSGRRTFINLCFESGVPINKLVGMTGHTNVATLMKYANKTSGLSSEIAKIPVFNL
ncbi:site-specific integrase [Hymenobacter sp. HSC-4F20]|uniref:tyrosine-type recombinase/integrase n=1 Tax=Hymenobacter sp. HSC-4F20 TaxID=2864135 RepID=UPI001C72A021|nr:phage integrase SAM-like domain-containing protein [Hymenobacter sp. HSC-4F20]MBX0290094.1 site-specific integrase [Hymenobacter sp. HSC-4F20]